MLRTLSPAHKTAFPALKIKGFEHPKACLARQTFVPKLQTLHSAGKTFHPALQIKVFLLQKTLFFRTYLVSVKKVNDFLEFWGRDS